MTKLKGISYFCKNKKPAPTSKDNQGNIYPRRYEISLGLDAAGQKEAKKLGLKINVANDKIPMNWTKITSNCDTDELLESRKPTVYYGKVPGYDGYIWNGSEVNVIGEIREFRGKPKFIWRAVQILSLGEEPEGWSEPIDVESELDDVDIQPDLNDSLDDL